MSSYSWALIIAGVIVSGLVLQKVYVAGGIGGNDFAKLQNNIQRAIDEYGKDNVCVTIPQGGQIHSDGKDLFDNNYSPVDIDNVLINKCE